LLKGSSFASDLRVRICGRKKVEENKREKEGNLKG
jgi:hypothetical protein